MPINKGKVKTQVLEIAFEEQGDASAHPIILSHGFPDDIRTWDNVISGLTSAGFRTLAPYVRGCGETRFLDSDTPRSGQYAAFAQDIIDFADALGLDQFTLVGHDWGARAAYPAAMLYPDRIQGMVTLAAGFGTGAPSVDAKEPVSDEQAKAYWYQWYFNTEKGREALEENRTTFCRALWKEWSPSWRHSKATYERTAQSFENSDFVNVVLHSYRNRWENAPGDPRYADMEKRLAKSPKVSVPTILLVGAEDGASLVKSSEGKEQHFSGEYVRRVLRGVGHFVPREAPEAVVDAVKKVVRMAIRS